MNKRAIRESKRCSLMPPCDCPLQMKVAQIARERDMWCAEATRKQMFEGYDLHELRRFAQAMQDADITPEQLHRAAENIDEAKRVVIELVNQMNRDIILQMG